jgi:hypothetical protein
MYNSYACRTGLFVALALLSACIVGSLGHEAVRLAHVTVIALDLLSCSVRSISLCLDSLWVIGSCVGDLLGLGVCLGLLRRLRVLRLASLTSIILLSCLGLDVVLKLCAVDVGVLAEAVLHVPTQSR